MSFSRPVRTGTALPNAKTQWTVRRRVATPPPTLPLNRRYEVSWLAPNGDIEDMVKMGPSVPLFQEAFTALGRGSMIPTDAGPVAVEDVLPGSLVMTSAGPLPLMWKGRTLIAPAAGPNRSGQGQLFRIPADAFGLGRPMPDLVLGPAARLLDRSPALRSALAAESALAPLPPMADGMSVIEVTPVTPVQVFHIGFERHCSLAVNGVDVESYHPGQIDPGALSPEMLELYLSLFPHVTALSGFGPLAYHRLTSEEYDDLHAA